MKSQIIKIDLAEIERANQFMRTIIDPTPLLKNTWLSKQLGFECYLKLESMLPVGSFKLRGAAYKISKLSPTQKKKGVICASAGNHAQGVAWASKMLGTTAVVVMPKSASLVKVQNTKALGAQVILHGTNYDEAYDEAKRISRVTGKAFVHAFEDSDVVAGQGTIGLELIEQLPEVDAVIASVGGGGLLAGLSTAIRAVKPGVKIYGCQAIGANAMYQSFTKGKAIALPAVNTFADGIAVRKASPSMYKILKKTIDGIYEADDEEIAESMLLLLEKAKIIAEASAAICLTVAEKIKSKLRGKNVVIVICGGNVDVNVIGRVIDRGLIKSGRRLRVNVWIRDIPGSLSQLTGIIAGSGANILQAIHDRNERSLGLKETAVELTLETRGHDHSKEILATLKKQVLRLDVLN
jgi:threonine dehydratase